MSKVFRQFQAKKPVQMNFPPLPKECIPFVWFDPNESIDEENSFKDMKVNYDRFISASEQYAKTSFSEMMESRTYMNDRPIDFNDLPPKQKFMILRKEKYFFKHHYFCGTFYAKAAARANQIATFLIYAIAFQVPTLSDFEGFKKSITKEFEDNTSAKRDYFRGKSLEYACIPIIQRQRSRNPTPSDVSAALHDASKLSNNFIHYCPPSAFDDVLEKFIKSIGKSQEIDNIAEKLATSLKTALTDIRTPSSTSSHMNSRRAKKRTERLLNLEEIDDTTGTYEPKVDQKRKIKPVDISYVFEFIDSFKSIIKISGESQRNIFSSAIIRIIFDQVYIKYPNFLIDDTINQMFASNCNKFKYLTPDELGITEGIFTGLQRTQPFTTIDSSNVLFRQAVELIMMTQFYVNPIDLVYSLFQSMQKFDMIMKRNSVESKMGSFISLIDEESISKLQLSMSFDDFFTIFYAAISVNPPSNSSCICNFLKAVSAIKVAPPMTYAASLFTAGVLHLQSSIPVKQKTNTESTIKLDPLSKDTI